MLVYRVIVSDITVTDTQMDNQALMIAQFQEENEYLPQQGEITRIKWLGKQKEGKKTNAIVVKLKDPKVANGLLMTRTTIQGGQPKKIQQYNQECIITQYFKCYYYGHLSKTCKAREVCGYCSSKEHNTKDHLDPKIKSAIKCVLYKGKHTVWSRAYLKMKAILTKILTVKKELLVHPYFPERVTITLTLICPIQHGKWARLAYILKRAGPCPPQPIYRVNGLLGLGCAGRSRTIREPLLGCITEAVYATPGQSVLALNSAKKVVHSNSCCRQQKI